MLGKDKKILISARDTSKKKRPPLYISQKPFQIILSLETLDHHKQIHNDIKPQNYLVKFLNRENDPTATEILLTDFGLAGSESKGGTPIFASPECLANPDRRDKSSDTFSLGRVFLMMILPKEKFLQFLFVPLIKGGKEKIMELIENEPILSLISKMMRIKNRIKLQDLRRELNGISEMKISGTITDISKIIRNNSSKFTEEYMDNLKHLS